MTSPAALVAALLLAVIPPLIDDTTSVLALSAGAGVLLFVGLFRPSAAIAAIGGALAHDLRSPVARLTAAIDTALAKVDDPDAADALQTARSDADLLRQMLKLERGNYAAGWDLSE